jgi:hypothetical protein
MKAPLHQKFHDAKRALNIARLQIGVVNELNFYLDIDNRTSAKYRKCVRAYRKVFDVAMDRLEDIIEENEKPLTIYKGSYGSSR